MKDMLLRRRMAGLGLAAAMVMLSVGSRVAAQVLETRTYATSGRPTEALATPDGQYVLVTVNREHGSSGIDVFRVEGETLKWMAFQPLGAAGAQGIVLIPGTRLLAVGLSNAGVAFLSLDDALRGKAKPSPLGQGERSGSGYLAVTPDGKYLFVANEYGEHGNIGVISLTRDKAGLSPKTVAHIPTPNTTPGVAISPDGTRLYVISEIVPPQVAARLPGHGVAELERSGCVQRDAARSRANGVLVTIDVAKAEALAEGSSGKVARAAVISAVDAGCSPVRGAVAADGGLVYVTARGDDRVLVFDTKKLEDARKLEQDSESPLVRAFATGGAAPVGLRLFDGDKRLLVANSNRFAGGAGSATVLDVNAGAKPQVLQTIRTGEFPRNITASPDGRTLYMTVFGGDELMVLRETQEP